MDLPAITQAFVLHFSPEPLNADQIVEKLSFSRSNVSMGLKELQAWNLVRLRRVPGDRRDYFTTPDDLWTIVRTLADERKKREVDPTLSMLREILMQPPATAKERHAQARMQELHDLIELLSQWYADVQRLDTERLVQLLSLGAKVQKILEMKDRLTLLPGRKAAGKTEESKTEEKGTA